MHTGLVMECEIRAGAYRGRGSGATTSVEAVGFDDVFERAGLVEALGLDGVWLAEHHFTPPHADVSMPGDSVVSSPLVLAAALGA